MKELQSVAGGKPAMKKAKLVVENGVEFEGFSFGYEASAAGEIVFNTAMVGYPESLTDPSYAGQILTITFPLVGNYGVPEMGFEAEGLSKKLEGDKIHVKGLIVSDYSEEYSHWDAVAQRMAQEGEDPCPDRH